MNEMVTKEATFTRVNDQGVIEEVNMITGEITVQGENIRMLSNVKYSMALGEIICQKLREGLTLRKISELSGMPTLHTIYAWRSTFPDFAYKMDQARVDRADYFFDKVLSVTETAEDASKDDVPALKLQSDNYRWAAEKGNPGKYGNKVEVENKHSGKIGFCILDTGIVRETIPAVEGECERIE